MSPFLEKKNLIIRSTGPPQTASHPSRGIGDCSELLPQVRKKKFHTAQIQSPVAVGGLWGKN